MADNISVAFPGAFCCGINRSDAARAPGEPYLYIVFKIVNASKTFMSGLPNYLAVIFNHGSLLKTSGKDIFRTLPGPSPSMMQEVLQEKVAS